MGKKDTATAYHEAAHAVVQLRAAGYIGGPITIIPDAERRILGTAFDGITDSFDDESARAQILSCYAGGDSDRTLGCFHEEQCCQDEELAAALLRQWGWEDQEAALRSESQVLVERHWKEIEVVAEELLRVQTLDETEVETLAAIAAGEAGVSVRDLQLYRWLKAPTDR